MQTELYSHNKRAYENAVSLLETRKKAAVIHTTGTGKSFIAFKLCEDNPDKKICWLSLSEYIFATQLENLKKASNGYAPRRRTRNLRVLRTTATTRISDFVTA